jgi:Mg-chelatase subunit ChlD/nitrous oxidase accessory protein NosD
MSSSNWLNKFSMNRKQRRTPPKWSRRLQRGPEKLEDRLLLTTYFVDDDNLPAAGSGTVGDPFTSIQVAINATVSGDDVSVAAGAYAEDLTMKSGVNVVGAGADQTTLTGTANVGGVVNFTGVSNSELAGFTITVGAPTPGVDRGVVFQGANSRTAVLKRNVITGVQYGAMVWTGSRPTMINNTFVSDGNDQQGIYIGNAATDPEIRNNIITGYAAAGIHVVAGTTSPVPVMEYNDVFANGIDYKTYPDQTGTNGNTSVDPLFVSASDFHLQAGSPAIDAGDPSILDSDGTVADMGAFESIAPPVTYFVDDDNTPGPGTGTDVDPFLSIQDAINAAVPTDTVLVSAGEYTENLQMKSGVNVLGAGADETKLIGLASLDGVVKFDGVNNAIFSGFHVTVDVPVPNMDRGVVFVGATDATARIERNVITNTQFGVWVAGAAKPTIENNTLVGVLDEEGVHIDDAATLRNNIITGFSRAGINVVDGSTLPNPIIEYNTVHNNGFDPFYTPRGNYLNYADQTGLNGNLDADPLFVDVPVFHLQVDSPAVNGGDPFRPTDPDGTVADQGAFAFGLASSSQAIGKTFTIEGLSHVPFELFSVTTEGTIEAEVEFSGGNDWTVLLTGRRRDELADPTTPYAEFTGQSPINISYDVKPEDLDRGVAWRLIVNPDPGDVGETGSINIHAPLHEATNTSFQQEKIALQSGEFWPSALLTTDFETQLAASGLPQQHGLISLGANDCETDFVLQMNGIQRQSFLPAQHAFGRVQQGTDLTGPDVAGIVTFVTPIEPEDKIEPNLLVGNYRRFEVDPGDGEVNYVLNGDGTLDLSIKFADDTEAGDIAAILAAHTLSHVEDRDTAWIANIDPLQLIALAQHDAVAWISQGPAPDLITLDLTRSEIFVDTVHDTDGITPVGGGGLPTYDGITGNGIIVGVDDSGIDPTHLDLTNVISNDPANVSHYHGTHVAGIVGGTGLNSNGNDALGNVNVGAAFQWHGVAPEVSIVDRTNLITGAAIKATIDAGFGLDVTTRSKTVELDGVYGPRAELIDSVTSGNASAGGAKLPRIPMVFAAGNEAWDDPQYGTDFGYFSLGGQAKNDLSVGNAVAGTNQISRSSSMGPTYDGRIKPDVIAPGSGVMSTVTDTNEVQLIEITGDPTAGAFQVSFNGNNSNAISIGDNQPTVLAALQAVAALSGNINVSLDTPTVAAGTTIRVAFNNAQGAQNVSELALVADDPTTPADEGHTLTGEIQHVEMTGNPTAGTFQLSFGGSNSNPIAIGDDQPAVLAALQAVAALNGNITVALDTATVTAATTIDVTFNNALARQDVAELQLVVDDPATAGVDEGDTLNGDGAISVSTDEFGNVLAGLHDSTAGNGHTSNGYSSLGGTSMAAPAVAGTLALMLEAFQETYNNPLGYSLDDNRPLPSTLRAVLIQTAADIVNPTVRWAASKEIDTRNVTDAAGNANGVLDEGDIPGGAADGNGILDPADIPTANRGVVVATVGPDYATGWGLMNGQAAVDMITDVHVVNGQPVPNSIVQNAVAQGQVYRKEFIIDANFIAAATAVPANTLKITTAWDDPAADITTPSTSPRLVNDLDVQLISPTGLVYLPWQLGHTVNAANQAVVAFPNATFDQYVPQSAVQPGGAWAAVQGGVDRLNNIEQVVVNPVDLELGAWTLRVVGFNIQEGGAQEFSVAGVPYPDLPDLFAFSDPTQKVTLPALGNPFQVDFSVRNKGLDPTVIPVHYQIRLSPDGYFDATDPLLFDSETYVNNAADPNFPSDTVIDPLIMNAVDALSATINITQNDIDDLAIADLNGDGNVNGVDLVMSDPFILVRVDTAGDPDRGEVMEHVESNNVTFLQLARRVDVVIVLDESGSMSADASVSNGTRPKISLLKESADLFLDMLRLAAGDRLGVVSFAAGSNIDFSDGGGPEAVIEVTAVNRGATGANPDVAGTAAKAVDDLDPGGKTNIKAGLQDALDLLDNVASFENRRRVIIFFSDGMKTKGGNPLDLLPDFAGDPGDLTDNITVYSVGFGTGGAAGTAGIDVDLLQAITNAGDDNFFEVTDVVGELTKFFVNAMAGAVDAAVLEDPVGTIGPVNQDESVDVVVDTESSVVTFVTAWDNPNADVELSVRTPSGQIIMKSNLASFGDNVRLVEKSTYQILEIRLPIITGAEEQHEGTWQARIHHKAGVITDYQASVYAQSTLRAELDPFEPGADEVFTPLEPVTLHLDVSGHHGPVSTAIADATVSVPLISLGNLLAAAGITHAEFSATAATFDNGEPLADQEPRTDTERLVEVYRSKLGLENVGELIPYEDRTFELLPDPNGGFTGTFFDSRVEGTYSFVVDVHGINDCGPFQREVFQSAAIGEQLDPNIEHRHPIDVEFDGHGDSVSVTVTPTINGGAVFGPGHGSDILVSVVGSSGSGVIVDNLDGSYTAQIDLGNSAHDPFSIEVSVGADNFSKVLVDPRLPAVASVGPNQVANESRQQVTIAVEEGSSLAGVHGLRIASVGSSPKSTNQFAQISADESAYLVRDFAVNPRSNTISFSVPKGMEPGRYLVHLESQFGLGVSSPNAELLVTAEDELPHAIEQFKEALRIIDGADSDEQRDGEIYIVSRPEAVVRMLNSLLSIPMGPNLTTADRQAGLDNLINTLYLAESDGTIHLPLDEARQAVNLAMIDSFDAQVADVPTPAGKNIKTEIGPVALGFYDVLTGGTTKVDIVAGPDGIDPLNLADPHLALEISTTARFDDQDGVDLAFPVSNFSDSDSGDSQFVRAYQLLDQPEYEDITVGFGTVDQDGNVEIDEDSLVKDTGALHFGSEFELASMRSEGRFSKSVLFARVKDLAKPVVLLRVPEVKVSSEQVTEGDPGDPVSHAVFDVTLSKGSWLPVTLDFSTVDGTAVGGLLDGDYQTTSGSLTFLPGETTKSVSVKIFQDYLDEQDERFELQLKNIKGATKSHLPANNSDEAMIINDDESRLFTRDFILNGSSSVPFELFSVIEPGSMEIEVSWTGSTDLLNATLTGRRRPTLADPTASYAQVTGVSPLTIQYDVTPADVERGVGWRLNLTDASGMAFPYATGEMNFRVPHDSVLDPQFQREKITVDSGEFWPSVPLHNSFVGGLAVTPGSGQHSLISQQVLFACCDPFERLGLLRQSPLQHGNYFGFVNKTVDLFHPKIAAAQTLLTPLEPEDKIDPHILLEDYESFTIFAADMTPGNAVMNPDGTLSLSVQFTDEADLSLIETILTAEAINYTAINKEMWRVELAPETLVDLAAYDEVAWIGAGVVDDQPELNNTRTTINANIPQNTAINAATNTIVYNGLSGNGITVGIEDSGLDPAHNDFNIVDATNAIGPGSHGTHVGGIVGASGVGSQAAPGGAAFQWRGVAPQVGLVDSNDLRTMDNMQTAIQTWSLDLTNRSRGISYDGQYNGIDRGIDQHIHGNALDSSNNPVAARPWVVSAGNRGAFPAGNQNQPAGPIPAAGVTATTAGGQISYFSNSKEVKNAVVVGNWDVANNRLSNSSSMGPTYDGRIKPDLVAPGTQVISTGTVGDNSCTNVGLNFTNVYTNCSGTSMASPAVAGVEALLLEAWQNTYLTPIADTIDTNPPLPATLRALMIQTATDIVQGNEDADNDNALDPGEDLNGNGVLDFGVKGQLQEPDVDRDSIQGNVDDRTGFAVATVGPDFATGWGMVNAGAAVNLLQDFRMVGAVPVPNGIVQDSIPHLGTKTYEFLVDQAFINTNAPLQVTLAWDDVEGTQQTPTTNANNVLNVKSLIHDLDLELVDPLGNVFLPWQLGHNTLAQGTLNVLLNNAQPPGTAIDVQLAVAPTSTPTQVWQSNGVVWLYQNPGPNNGVGGGTDYIPANVFQAGGAWVAQPGRDHLNNVEQVSIPSAQLTAGHWEARVRGFDVQQEGFQEFAMVGMPYPDLPDIVASSTVRAAIGGFAQNIDFTWNAANVGPVATGAAFPFEVALSTDYFWDAGTDIILTDLLAGVTQNVPAIAGNNGNSGAINSRVQITQAEAQTLVNQMGGAPDGNGNGFDLVDFLATDPFILVRADSPSAILEHNEENVAAIQMSRLVDVVLVYDDSGSMDSDALVSTGQRPKIELLKDSANLFLDLMRLDFGDRLGEVRFATDLFGGGTDDMETLFVQQNNNTGSITGFTTGNQPNSKAVLGTKLAASGGTNIRDGLQRGHDLITGATAGASRRRVLIFFSDGMKTAGADPTAVAFLNQFTTNNIDIYSVGFGTEGGGNLAGIDIPLLQQLANVASDGFFHVTSEATDLDKFFVNAVAAATNQAVLVDPQDSIVADGFEIVPVQVGQQDGEVSFIMTWDDPTVDVDLSLKTPAGATINADNAALFGGRVSTIFNSAANQPYEIFTVKLPLQIGADEEHGGSWEMLINNPSAKEVNFSASAIGETTVRAALARPLPPGDQTTFYPGQPIPLEVSFHGNNLVPMSGALTTVTTEIPVVSMGNLLSSGLITPEELALVPDTISGEPVSLQTRLVQAYQNKFDGNPLVRETIPSFELDENHNGHYSGAFTGNIPGAYGFTIDLTGKDDDCDKYARQIVRYNAVENPVHGNLSPVDVVVPGDNTVVATVTPVGAGGMIGPGFSDHVVIGGEGLNPTTAVIDNLDGSYTQSFTVGQGNRHVDINTTALGVLVGVKSIDVGFAGSAIVGPAGGRNDTTNTVTIGVPAGVSGDVTGVELISSEGTVGLTELQINSEAGEIQATVPSSLGAGRYRINIKSGTGSGFSDPSLAYNVVGAGREFPDYVESLDYRISRLLSGNESSQLWAQGGRIETTSMNSFSNANQFVSGNRTDSTGQSMAWMSANRSGFLDPGTERRLILGELLQDVRLLPEGRNVTPETRQAALDEIISLLVEDADDTLTAGDIPNLLALNNESQVDSRYVPNFVGKTDPGVDVDVDAGQQVTVRFGEVLAAGETLVNLAAGPVAFNKGARGTTFQTYDVVTTATFDPSDEIDVEINYEQADFTSEENLRIYHLEGDKWVDRTYSLDTDANVIVARTSSLSPFVVMQSDGVPQLSINDVSQLEGSNTASTDFTFTVQQSVVSSETVTVDFVLNLGSAQSDDLSAQQGTLTFNPGVTSQPLTISVVGDNQFEADETFTIELIAAEGATITDSDGSGTIQDDDSFNVEPTLNAISNFTIVEDASLLTLALTGISPGGGQFQPVRVTASSSNTELISDIGVSYLSPESTGSLAFAAAPDQNGASTITVTVEDGGHDKDLNTSADNATVQRSFVLAVQAVNDIPVANDLNQGTNEDTPLEVYLPFSDVDGDSLAIQIISSDLLEGVQVEVDGGKLALLYDPSGSALMQQLNAFGTFQESVVLSVNDGNGGSATATITFTVQGVTDWQNPVEAMDVDSDGFVTPADVLAIINTLNQDGSRYLDTIVNQPSLWYDSNGDGYVLPTDALKIINHLNYSAPGEGEFVPSTPIIRDLYQGSAAVEFLFSQSTIHDMRWSRENVAGGETDVADSLESFIERDSRWLSNNVETDETALIYLREQVSSESSVLDVLFSDDAELEDLLGDIDDELMTELGLQNDDS